MAAEEAKVDRSELFALEGSCHCGKVTYSCKSAAPYPYMVCHCLTDTKTNGFNNINIRALTDTLKVTGEEHVKTYAADMFKITGKEEDRGTKSHHERKFCGECGSFLWAFSSKWPTWIYPFANSVDTELPTPPELFHIFTDSKKSHIKIPEGCKCFTGYPDRSIEAYHKEHGLLFGPPAPEPEKEG